MFILKILLFTSHLFVVICCLMQIALLDNSHLNNGYFKLYVVRQLINYFKKNNLVLVMIYQQKQLKFEGEKNHTIRLTHSRFLSGHNHKMTLKVWMQEFNSLTSTKFQDHDRYNFRDAKIRVWFWRPFDGWEDSNDWDVSQENNSILVWNIVCILLRNILITFKSLLLLFKTSLVQSGKLWTCNLRLKICQQDLLWIQATVL